MKKRARSPPCFQIKLNRIEHENYFNRFKEETKYMAFFTASIDVLKVLVIALGSGLGLWGVINLLEGYGNDNPGANAHVR